MGRSLKIILSIIILIILAFFIFIFTGSQIYTDWLWFGNVGYSGTFVTMFFTNLWLRLVVGIIFSLFIFVNLFFTKKPLLDYVNIKKDDTVESLFGGQADSVIDWLSKKRINFIFLLGSIILGFLFSSISQDLWKIVLKYFNQTPFGTTDPIFGKDVAFYIFSLPFFNFLREMGMVLVVLTFIVTGIIYILASGVNSFNELKFKLSARGKGHMTLLVVFFLFLKAWGYKLSMFDLLYSPRGVAFGASYTDIHANLLGLKILFFIALIIGIISLINLFKKSYRVLIWGLGIWLLTSFIFGSVYPGFVQRFQVEPNEIVKESEYIGYNIDMTLKGYGLDNLTQGRFEVLDNLNPEILEENKSTLNNIRIWDPRPLRATYRQLQELRPYYSFVDVDIDRYYIDGEYRQVMLSGREIDQKKLDAQAQTWINQILKYTHGYGLVMSPVNQVTNEGLPEFFIKDIPPRTSVDIEVNNPRIYYGEETDNYVIVNNKTSEFDYPLGSENAYYDYTGTGGIQLNSLFKKIIYGLRYGNIKFLLADDITKESRILYYRNIKERVRKVAPFLSFDSDPYLVISEGRLFWIQDAYTTTDRYPYSQPIGNIGNYIRNSVKIVIDAYNGSMNFFIADNSDPLILTYQKIFPDLFSNLDKMPDDLRQHLRYPQDLFVIQANLYTTYHMTDPTVYYNKEDLWNIPIETYGGANIAMEPYYIIMELPDSNGPEFILMLPFTPANKNNMVAWMAARSDGEKYGQLLVYNFPKDKLVYGPTQIESRIDQDTDISQLLTLWSQRGSRVIRGNLLVIPINNSLLYVEPIYLQAETSELPEMKRVIVAYKDRIIMRESFEESLNVIFGITEEEAVPLDEEIRLEEGRLLPESIKELAAQAVEIYQQAQESLKEGDWTGYGQFLEELEDILERLSKLTAEE